MAINDKTNIDDYSLDDDNDLDFLNDAGFDDIPGSDATNGKNRKPISKLASGFRQSALSKGGASSFAKGAIFAALPKSYNHAYDEVLSIKNDFSNFYDEIHREAEPAIKASKNILRTFTPITNKLLPKGIASRLDKALSNEDDDSGNYDRSEESRNDEEITTVLTGIFGAEKAQNESQHKEDLAHTELDRNINKKQFEYSSKVQLAQANYLSRLVGYQDSVLSAYHKKSLELQYKHYFVAKQSAAFMMEASKNQLAELGSIRLNTSLPNEAKVETSEIFRNRAKNLMVGTVQDYSRSKLGNFATKLRTNLLGEFKEYFGAITDIEGQLEMMKTMSSMAEEDGDGIEKMIGESLGEEGMGMLGKQLGKKSSAKVFKMLQKYFPNIQEDVKVGAKKLERFRVDAPNRVLRKLKDSNGQGVYGYLDRVLNESYTRYDTINRNLREDATETVGWDILSRRTLIDIIPGYLSRQLQKLSDVYNILSGSTEKSDRVVYSLENEKFTTEKKKKKEVMKNFKEKINYSVKEDVGVILKHIDPNGTELTPSERVKLSVFLAKESEDKFSFNPVDYTDPFNLPHELAQKVAPLFAAAYGIESETAEGDWISPEKRKVKDTEEFADKHLKATQAFQNIYKKLGVSNKLIDTHYGTGDTDILHTLGIVNDLGVDPEFKWKLVEQMMESGNKEDFLNTDNLLDNKELNTSGKVLKKGLLSSIKNKIKPNSISDMVDDFDAKPNRLEKKQFKMSFKEDTDRIIKSGVDNTTKLSELLERIAIGVESFSYGSDNGFVGPRFGTEERLKSMAMTGYENGKKLASTLYGAGSSMFKLAGKLLPSKERLGSVWNTFTNVTGFIGSILGSGAKHGFDLTKSIFGYSKDKLKEFHERHPVSSLMESGKENLSKTKSYLHEHVYNNLKAVYLKGKEKVPRLSIKGFLSGKYFDKETLNPIGSPEEITGAVVDENGDPIISEEEFAEGLVDSDGNPITSKLKEHLNSFKDLFSKEGRQKILAKHEYLRTLAAHTKPATRLKALWAKTYVTADLLVSGEQTPRIKADKMKAGMYVDARTMKPILSIHHIRGALLDISGDKPTQVLSDEEAANGLYDATTGKLIKISKLLIKGHQNINKLKSKVTGSKLYSALAKFKIPATGIANSVLDKFTNTVISRDSSTEKILEKIYDHFQKVMPEKSSEQQEADREGGVNDIRRRRESRRNRNRNQNQNNQTNQQQTTVAGAIASQTTPEENKDDNGTGMFGGLSDGFKEIGGVIAGSMVGSKLGRIGLGLGKGLWKLGGGIGKVGLGLGRFALGMGDLAFLGAGLLGEAIGVIGTGLGAIVGLVTAPVSLAVIGTALAAYGAYKIYKNIDAKRPLTDLEKLRYLQYGIPIDNIEAIKALRFFEAQMEDTIEISKDGKVTINKSMNDIWKDNCAFFNSTEDDTSAKQNFNIWFANRFYLVYVKYVVMANGFKSKLDNIDDLPDDIKIRFVNAVQFGDDLKSKGADPYSVTQSPFSNIHLENRVDLIDTLSKQIINKAKGILSGNAKNSNSIKDDKDVTKNSLAVAKQMEEETKKQEALKSPMDIWESTKNAGKELVNTFESNVENPFKEKAKLLFDKSKPYIQEGVQGVKAAGDWLNTNVVEPVANSLSSLIQGAESGKAGYNAYNRGTLNNKILGPIGPRNLTKMTIGEILADMDRNIGDPQRLFAVGKYQMTPGPLREAIAALGIDKNTLFNEATQERLFSGYFLSIKKKKIGDYITGKSDNIMSALTATAEEWASVADPKTGASRYGNGNKASVSAQKLSDILNNSRSIYSTLIAHGLSKDEAFQQAVSLDKVPDNTKTTPNKDPYSNMTFKPVSEDNLTKLDKLPDVGLASNRNSKYAISPNSDSVTNSNTSVMDSNIVNNKSTDTTNVSNNSTTIDTSHISKAIVNTGKEAASQRDEHLNVLKDIHKTLSNLEAAPQYAPTPSVIMQNPTPKRNYISPVMDVAY